ncbi:energy-coupling factor transporter transmembrane protein EcfT [Paenibacillus sp. N3/727]|uniref:energy-coupling factor transporter transmembrane component T family protein n=1 Tax=Paenibacillus sp. N3/727 TaxID=2925845 RepID=UPI001F53BEBF|nr:energy-coupling factor transporter transmembrane component T [Paenibacillus sp. N3/727]UNK18722.1 energy-coupling factor transporter transmembrane protein EcfT [Paenibacillus sp. N3/727]
MSNLGALSSLQYAAGDSLLHRLDPRSKYSFAFSYSVTLIISNSLIMSLVCMVIAIFLYLLSGVRLLMLWKNSLGIIVFLLILAGFQASLNGIEAAALMTLKVLSFFLMITLMLSTTPPEKQMEGLRKLLTPLRRLGINTETFVFMFTVAVIYMPLLLEDTMRILQAQRVRGLHDGRWNIAGRGKDVFLLLTPLLLVIIRRAERLSEAMESRCYQPGCERTGYYQLKIAKHDIIVLVLALLFPLIFLYLK